jgi:adenylate kinase family enzyme
MERVLVLGCGASGKSTLAAALGAVTGLPVVELDRLFWRPDLTPTSKDEWREIQSRLVTERRWILDGDLGPYDVVDVRLGAADAVIWLDFATVRCAWRAMRRSRERLDFWMWLLLYRFRSRPLLLRAIREHAPQAEVYVLRNPQAVEHFLEGVRLRKT